VRRTLAVATVVALALSAAIAVAQRDPFADLQPTVILVSFDGFRWDYTSKVPTPNLRQLMARGVHAQNLIPSFPSKTFPNHYTIVTGLYPGHHGIVANNLFDPPTGRTFAMAKRAEVQDPMWWGGTPIWTLIERAGHASGAACFWPRSEATHDGIQPRYWRRGRAKSRTWRARPAVPVARSSGGAATGIPDGIIRGRRRRGPRVWSGVAAGPRRHRPR
jgi:hypothetical protein